MKGVGRRNPQALERMYDRYSADVHAVALRVLRNAADAEDATIDTFWDIWNRCSRYDPARATVYGYLMLVAKSRAIDLRRRRAGWNRAETGAALPADRPRHERGGHETAMWRVEQRRIVLSALSELEPRHRRAIRMSFLDGLSHGEIAERLGEPLGTVKTWIRQGLIRLRDMLQHIQ